jgi:hypothetical protein
MTASIRLALPSRQFLTWLALFVMLLLANMAARSQCTCTSSNVVCVCPTADQTVTQPILPPPPAGGTPTTLFVKGQFASQVGNQIYHAEMYPASPPDPCSQIKAAIAAMPTAPLSTSGGIVDGSGFQSSVTDFTPCLLNPFASISQSISAGVAVQLLLGRQTLTLTRQWVIPVKSGIVGMNGTGGYTSSSPPASNTVIVACNATGIHSPYVGCTGSPVPKFVPWVNGCTFTPPSPPPGTGKITGCSDNPNVNVGNFVLIEGTGTDLDNPWPVTGTETNGFDIEYTGTTGSVSNVAVAIPLVWLGNGAGLYNANGGATTKNDEGVYLENLAVDCNDLPHSIGIFSATANEDSRLNHVMVRYCSRNGVYYQNYGAAGAPANFGTDRDLQIYMSNSSPGNPSAGAPSITSITTVSSGILKATLPVDLTLTPWLGYPIMFSSYPGVYTVIAETNGSSSTVTFASSTISTCSSCTGTVSVIPAGYRASIGAAPFRGLEDATIRPDTVANNALDGIQFDGVLGGTVKNIHCEHLNNCVHITSKASSTSIDMENLSAGLGSAQITGALYANEPNNGGTSITLSGLANYGTTRYLVYDPLALSTAHTISGTNLAHYTTGTGGSIGKPMQSCGTATLSSGSGSLTCPGVTSDSFCMASPSTSTLTFTPSANTVAISGGGSLTFVGVSCTI